MRSDTLLNTEIKFPGLGLEFDPPTDLPFTVFGHSIKWYGVIIAVGFLLAVVYALKRCHKFGYTRDDLIDVLIIAAPVGIICARLYFCLFYNAAYYLEHPIEMLYIWKGGLAIYGGIIGGLLCGALVSKIKGIKPLAVLDLAAIGFPLAQSIGRWGNFMNREAFGAATDSLFRMELFVDGRWTTAHPCFLYESVWNLIGFVILHFISKKRKFDGQVLLCYIAWYGVGRMFIEGLRTDSLYVGSTGIRVSQMLAAVSALVAIVLLVVILLRKPDPNRMQVEVFEREQARKTLEKAAEGVQRTESMVDSSASAPIEPSAEITFDPPQQEGDEGDEPTDTSEEDKL